MDFKNKTRILRFAVPTQNFLIIPITFLFVGTPPAFAELADYFRDALSRLV